MKLLLGLLPLLLRIVGTILDKTNASTATKKKVIELAEAAADDGLISIQAKDKFKAQRLKILAGIEKEKQK